jgi:hypothetical protein
MSLRAPARGGSAYGGKRRSNLITVYSSNQKQLHTFDEIATPRTARLAMTKVDTHGLKPVALFNSLKNKLRLT